MWRILVLAMGFDGEVTTEKARIVLTGQAARADAAVLVGERRDGALRTSLPVAFVVRP